MGTCREPQRATSGVWAPLFAVAVAMAALAGCSGGGEPTLILSIRSRVVLSRLDVAAKLYRDDGGVTLYPVYRTPVPAELEGYVLPAGTDPLQVRVDLPEPGRYALHLVGIPLDSIEDDPAGDRYVAAVCAEVTDVTVVDDVLLGRLTRGPASLDIDSDDFPEDVAAFCAFQADTGVPCDTSCAGPDYLAMGDCNPGPDWQDPGCGSERGEDAAWNPFAVDQCGDCLDRDCYGGDAMCEDLDGDGYPGDVDCDDRDATVNPGASELCGNGVDENCSDDVAECTDGDVPCDADGDGFLAVSPTIEGCGRDCDDADPAVNPNAFEGYGSDPSAPERNPGCDDGVDNNCDGRVDERCSSDLDDDGVERGSDCNDCNAAVGPGFDDACDDGVDENCDGVDLACAPDDLDRDGFGAAFDCDEADATVFNGAPDRCGDDAAQNCSAPTSCTADGDGDFYNADDGDCDDSNPAAHPWATEVCDADGVDEDCDGTVNEVTAEAWGERGCGFDRDGDDAWAPIDYLTDLEHCGWCNHACAAGAAYREGDACVAGACSCFGEAGCAGGINSFCCPDGCQNISADVSHCGDCETRCALNELCLADPTLGGRGRCSCQWEPGAAACDPLVDTACCEGVGCVNTEADPANCGACGNDCTAEGETGPRGDLCAVGPGGQPTCFCGAVGVVCSGSEWCTDVTEPAGCGCADLGSDAANCGACGAACDENESCVEGACTCLPAGADCAGGPNATCCPGTDHCVALREDTANCGACGRRCAPGEVCYHGECTCEGEVGCAYGSQVCWPDAGCTDVLRDSSICGPATSLEGCGFRCEPGQPCFEGQCGCDPRCNPGEECIDGECQCGADCNDGDSCTEDACLGGRCDHVTLDGDDDGYCASWCTDGTRDDCIDGDCDDSNASANPGRSETCATAFDDDCDGSANDLNATGCTTYSLDHDDDTWGVTGDTQCRCAPSGDYTATRGGDCADSNAARNPAATEQCNGVDDDCNGSTADGASQCPGACCGSPAACRTCCSDAQCTATHDYCSPSSWSCLCETGWSDCAGDCDCFTGGSFCCSGSSCVDTSGSGVGSGCCSASHCGSGSWNCSGNSCSCAVEVCSGDYCRAAGQCCDAADCGPGSWTCTAAHNCSCAGLVCGGTCMPGVECCDDPDCWDLYGSDWFCNGAYCDCCY